MAAGAGRRIGGRPKGLLMREGMPLIERQLRALSEVGITHAVVVLGHHAERIEPVLRELKSVLAPQLDLCWAMNARPDDGPGSSLRTGLAALPSELDAVLVALADQPLLAPPDIQAVLHAWQQRARSVRLVVPVFEGQPGHPVIFDAAVRADIVAQSGGTGLRDWRREHAAQVQLMPVDHPRYTLDIDSEPDRAGLQARWGIMLTWPEDLSGSDVGGG